MKMKIQDKLVRGQLELLKPIADNAGLELSRSFQNRIGRLIQFRRRHNIVVSNQRYSDIPGALIIPKEELFSGIILYLHGGGYTCGSIDYARGVAAILSSECGMRVFCLEYPLAPENPYPAALDAAYSAYLSLLEHGYAERDIIIAGESAGGGLAYALALKLRDEGRNMPAGIIAISPWCDLTLSGDSYVHNHETDPSLTKNKLKYFSDCYVGAIKDARANPKTSKSDTEATLAAKKNPYVSPIFADLGGLVPSIIFVGGDEILLSDSITMHDRLTESGNRCQIIIKDGMWHGYLLYGLKSARNDFSAMCDFIRNVLPDENRRRLRWMHLDNAAKIYPAAATSRWSNVFRISATMSEAVDANVLQSALDVTVRRFPSIAVRLRRGVFWYYLEEIKTAPKIKKEAAYPLVRMPFDDIRSCAFRVIVYKNRIAVEFFHALTDGNGGLVFLKNLLAEYVTQKYGIEVPNENGVLDRLEPPNKEELTDKFPEHAAKVGISRMEDDAYRIYGTPEGDGFCHNVTMRMKSSQLVELAHKIGVTVTAVLAAAIMEASMRLQKEDEPDLKRRKPVKLLLPVDLRRVFNVGTLRNFALYITPGIDTRLGDYGFEELCHIISKKMSLEITRKNMSARIYTNVHDEQVMALKLTPLFLKNIVMKAVFRAVGERKSTLTLSNLGVVKLPESMRQYVERFDFVLGVQQSAPYNIGLISYGDTAYMNVIRNIEEPRLEYELYQVLRENGIFVVVESNSRTKNCNM